MRYPSRVTPMCYIFVYFTTPTDVTIDIKDVYITVEAVGCKGASSLCLVLLSHICGWERLSCSMDHKTRKMVNYA